MTGKFGSRPEDEALIREATEGIDDSALSEGAADQYPLIPGDEIIAADSYYPLKGMLQRMANEELTRGRLQAEGESTRLPETHREGWNLTIDTEGGQVTLWSCWTGDQLELRYAGNPIPDDEIKELLEVEEAQPVAWDGQFMYGSNATVRQWGRFWGPKLPEGGRVWVETEGHGSAPTPRYINEQGIVERADDLPNSVRTFPFSFFKDESPESPNATSEAIREYSERFILLAAEIAVKLGKPKGVSTEFAFMVKTPEDLQREGYTTQQVKGNEGVRQGWGSELIVGIHGNETVALESANEVVPWVNVRRLAVDETVATPHQLAQRIIEDDLYF